MRELKYFVVFMCITGSLAAADKGKFEGDDGYRMSKRAKCEVSSYSSPLELSNQQNLLAVPATHDFSAFLAELHNNPTLLNTWKCFVEPPNFIYNLEDGNLVIIFNFCTNLEHLILKTEYSESWNVWHTLRCVSKRFYLIVNNTTAKVSIDGDFAELQLFPWRFVDGLQNLKILKLKYIKINDKFARNLIILLSNHRLISSLTLTACTGAGIFSDGHLDMIAEGLSEVLASNQSPLSHIKIISDLTVFGEYGKEGNKSCFTCQGIEKILMALESNTVLQYFWIDLIAPNDVLQCVISLAECLKKNATLKALVIGTNLISSHYEDSTRRYTEDAQFLGYYLNNSIDFPNESFDIFCDSFEKKEAFKNAIEYLRSRADLSIR